MFISKLVIICFIFMTGCTQLAPATDHKWFKKQNSLNIIDSLTECGPTVGRNLLCWQTGICPSPASARETILKPTWWRIYNIRDYVLVKEGEIKQEIYSKNSVLDSLGTGSLVVLHVDGLHFITLQQTSTNIILFDTLFGSEKVKDVNDVLTRVSYNWYLSVPNL